VDEKVPPNQKPVQPLDVSDAVLPQVGSVLDEPTLLVKQR
jgi:hypothetical protein